MKLEEKRECKKGESVCCGTISSSPIYLLLESPHVGTEEILEDMMAPKFSNYENYKPTDPSSMNNRHKKHEVNNTRQMITLLRASDKKKKKFK